MPIKLRANAMISVIIIAYDRREYIKKAINSVISQSLNREKFEIIVIKNYKDREIDEYIDQNCDKNVYSENKSLSRKIKEAVMLSKYDIISFLEDDDAFYDEKLKTVLQEFSENKNLVYFHNACKFIDEDGKFLKYGGFGPDFNLSSISIRKSSIDQDLILDSSVGLDTFMYLACLDTGGKIAVDKRPLTIYMLHVSSSVFKGTFNETILHYCQDSQEFLDNIKTFSERVKTEHVKEILLNMSIKFRLNLNIYSIIAKQKKPEKLSLSELLRFLFKRDEISLSLKTKAVKLFEYYAPYCIKKAIEERRFVSGHRPT